jgi:AcrR family transcriptional regulator
MQVQKKEMKQELLEAAKKEFLLRGFKAASMRTIARKANTTIGNIYNYFSSKEAIFNEVIGELPKVLGHLLESHSELTSKQYDDLSLQEINQLMDGKMSDLFVMDTLLSDEFIILMEGAQGTEFEEYRQQFEDYCNRHMMEHLPGERNRLLAKSMSHSFLTVLLYIAKNMKDLDEGKKELTRVIQILILGILTMEQTSATPEDN